MGDDGSLIPLRLLVDQRLDRSDPLARNAIKAWAVVSLSAHGFLLRMLMKVWAQSQSDEIEVLAGEIMNSLELDEMARQGSASESGWQGEQDAYTTDPANLRACVEKAVKSQQAREALDEEAAKLARERGPRTLRGLSTGSPGHTAVMLDNPSPALSAAQVQIQSTMKLLDPSLMLRSLDVTSLLTFKKAVDALNIRNQGHETDLMTLIDLSLHTRIIQLYNSVYPVGGAETVALEPLTLNNFFVYSNLQDDLKANLKIKNDWVLRELFPSLLLTSSEQEAAVTFYRIFQAIRFHYAKCSTGQQEPMLEALAQNVWLCGEALQHIKRCVDIKSEGSLRALACQVAPLKSDLELLQSNFPRLYIKKRESGFDAPSGKVDTSTGKVYRYSGIADDLERHIVPRGSDFAELRTLVQDALREAQVTALKTVSNPLTQLEAYLGEGIRILGERFTVLKETSKGLNKLFHTAPLKVDVSFEIVPRASTQSSSLNRTPSSSSQAASSPAPRPRTGFSTPHATGSNSWQTNARRLNPKALFGAVVEKIGNENREEGEDDQGEDDDEPSELEALEDEMQPYEDQVGWGGMPESDPETKLFALGAETSAAQGEMAYCAMTRSQTTQDPQHAQPSGNQLSQRAMAQGQLSPQEMKLRACRAWIDGKCKHVVSPRNCEWSHEVGPLHRAYEYKAGFKEKISGEADKILRFIKSLGPEFQLKR